MKPFTTIFADASYSPATRMMGWGAWVISDSRHPIHRGGAVLTPVETSAHAELVALVRAMSVAHEHRLLTGIVMLQSDCLDALGMILTHIKGARNSPHAAGLDVVPRRKPIPESHMLEIEKVQAMKTETGVIILLRHVKGHKLGGGRSWVNRFCDRVAREQRIMAEKLVEKPRANA